MTKTKEQLIQSLTNLQTDLFDEESRLLGQIDKSFVTDMFGNKIRRIEVLREYQSDIVQTISIMNTITVIRNE